MNSKPARIPAPHTTRRWLPWLLLTGLVLFAFVEMSYLSLAKYWGFNSKYFDLGAMSQAIWSATQGLPLIFTGQGIAISRLARNVELFYFAIAPVYALFPTPQTLLVIQALLYALGAIPVFRLAQRKLDHPYFALALAAIYLFYPVAQTAVLAEFHSDTLAAAFLLFAIEAADRQAWRSYGVWLALALSCKFYVAAPVAALGIVLWFKGERKAGMATTLAAILWGAIAFFAIRSTFAPPAEIAAQAVNVQSSTAGYILNRFQLGYVWDTATIRLVHAVIVLMPTLLLLAWRAPLWLLPAAVTVIPALLSNGFGPSFSYRTHHYALAVPFLVTAVLFGTVKQLNDAGLPGQKPAWQGRLLLTLFMVLVFNLAFIDTPISPQFYLDRPHLEQGLSKTRFGTTSRDEFKGNWLATNVPPNVPIAADQLSAVRLTNREILYLTTYVFGRPLEELLPELNYIITDALYDAATADPVESNRIFGGGVNYEYEAIRTILTHPEFQLLTMQDGLLLFGKADTGLDQTITSLTNREAEGHIPLTTFSNEIALLAYNITKIEARRYRIEATWQLVKPLANAPNRFAVTQLVGVPHTRLVHLPASILLPPKEWTVGETIQESFEFELPSDIPSGTYDLTLGWYDADHIFAAHTDERSRLGAEVNVDEIIVP